MAELADFCIVAKDGRNWSVKAERPDLALGVAKKRYKHVRDYEIVRILQRTNNQNHDWNENPEHHIEYKIIGDYIQKCDGTEEKPYMNLL